MHSPMCVCVCECQISCVFSFSVSTLYTSAQCHACFPSITTSHQCAPKSFWSCKLFQLVVSCAVHPQTIGFNVGDVGTMDRVPKEVGIRRRVGGCHLNLPCLCHVSLFKGVGCPQCDGHPSSRRGGSLECSNGPNCFRDCFWRVCVCVCVSVCVGVCEMC